MSKEIYWVFVSSTSRLAAERESIRRVFVDERLDAYFHPYQYERDGGAGNPERIILREIKKSDLFVLLLAEDFGTPHPRSTEKDPISIVQSEFRRARRLGSGRIMVFLKDVEITDENQKRFVAEVTNFCAGEWTWTFGDRRKLKLTFRQALSKWMAEGLRHAKKLKRGLVTYNLTAVALCTLLLLLRDAISGPSYYFVAAMLTLTAFLAPLIFLKYTVDS